MLKTNHLARLATTGAAVLALGVAAPPALAAGGSTPAGDQYGGVLGEQSGPGQAQRAGTLPFTGLNLVVLLGAGAGLTAAGVATRRLSRSV